MRSILRRRCPIESHQKYCLGQRHFPGPNQVCQFAFDLRKRQRTKTAGRLSPAPLPTAKKPWHRCCRPFETRAARCDIDASPARPAAPVGPNRQSKLSGSQLRPAPTPAPQFPFLRFVQQDATLRLRAEGRRSTAFSAMTPRPGSADFSIPDASGLLLPAILLAQCASRAHGAGDDGSAINIPLELRNNSSSVGISLRVAAMFNGDSSTLYDAAVEHQPVARSRWYPLAMRRWFASVLLLLTALLPLQPLIASAQADASLPACCRRSGAHHCMM